MCEDINTEEKRMNKMKKPSKFHVKLHVSKQCTGGPRYMREIGTPKICSNIMNLHKKTNDHCKLEDRFQKKGHFSIA